MYYSNMCPQNISFFFYKKINKIEIIDNKIIKKYRIYILNPFKSLKTLHLWIVISPPFINSFIILLVGICDTYQRYLQILGGARQSCKAWGLLGSPASISHSWQGCQYIVLIVQNIMFWFVYGSLARQAWPTSCKCLLLCVCFSQWQRTVQPKYIKINLFNK